MARKRIRILGRWIGMVCVDVFRLFLLILVRTAGLFLEEVFLIRILLRFT
jgi:hypothetical protein